jgi:hypothetical protein
VKDENNSVTEIAEPSSTKIKKVITLQNEEI